MSSTPLHGGLIERRNINLSGQMSRIDFTSPFAGFPMVKHYNNSENLLQNNKPNWSVHKDSDLEFEGAPPEMRPLLNLLRHSRSKLNPTLIW